MELLQPGPRDYQVRGDGIQLFDWVDGLKPAPREAMFEGPAGTGKTRSICELIRTLMLTFPGCSIVMLRKTRVSLNDAMLRTWEQWTLGYDHWLVHDGPRRQHRDEYLWRPLPAWDLDLHCNECYLEADRNGLDHAPMRVYQRDGDDWWPTDYLCQVHGVPFEVEFASDRPILRRSRLVVAGMNEKTRLFSSEYCAAIINELIELTQDEWQSLHRAVRAPGTPFKIVLGDTNPDDEGHWANLRAEPDRPGRKAMLHRMRGRFSDNPTMTVETLSRLRESTTGVIYERLFEGRWCKAEGLIWPQYDRHTHVLSSVHDSRKGIRMGIEKRPEEDRWVLHVDGWKPRGLHGFVFGFDYGYEDPGDVQVWGLDRHGRAYLVAEVYRWHWDDTQWVDCILGLWAHFKPGVGLMDGASKGLMVAINRAIERESGGQVPGFFHAWDKRRDKSSEKAGIGQVRTRFLPRPDGEPGLYILNDAHLWMGQDSDLAARKKPLSLKSELGQYVYRLREDGKPYKEEPDPTCVKHACDVVRGVMAYLDSTGHRPHVKEPGPHPDTVEAKVLKKAQEALGRKRRVLGR